MTASYALPVKTLKALGTGGPPANGDLDEDPPPPGKNWIRFDFPPCAATLPNSSTASTRSSSRPPSLPTPSTPSRPTRRKT